MFLLQTVKSACPSLPLGRMSYSWIACFMFHCKWLYFLIYFLIPCLGLTFVICKYRVPPWQRELTLLFKWSIPPIQKIDFWSFWGLHFQGFVKYHVLAVTFPSAPSTAFKIPIQPLVFLGNERENTWWILNILVPFFVLCVPNMQVAQWSCSPLYSGCLLELVVLTSWSWGLETSLCLSFSWTISLRSLKSSLQ